MTTHSNIQYAWTCTADTCGHYPYRHPIPKNIERIMEASSIKVYKSRTVSIDCLACSPDSSPVWPCLKASPALEMEWKGWLGTHQTGNCALLVGVPYLNSHQLLVRHLYQLRLCSGEHWNRTLLGSATSLPWFQLSAFTQTATQGRLSNL